VIRAPRSHGARRAACAALGAAVFLSACAQDGAGGAAAPGAAPASAAGDACAAESQQLEASGTYFTTGLLVGAAGFGSLAAALFLAWRGGRHAGAGLDRLVGRAALAGGSALACFAWTPAIEFAFPLLAMLGCAVVLTAAGSNTLIQLEVREDFRGRVMAIFSTAFLGIAPLGSLAVGLLSEWLDVRPTLSVCGLLALAAGWLYRREVSRLPEPMLR